jgi:hypothetical protein
VDGNGVTEDEVDDPPCGFDCVLPGEEHPLAVEGSADEPVVGRMSAPPCSDPSPRDQPRGPDRTDRPSRCLPAIRVC